MTTEMRYYEVVGDPHRQYAPGTRLTTQQVWELLADGAGNGLEVSDGVRTFRLYQSNFYRLEADGLMRLWSLPKWS